MSASPIFSSTAMGPFIFSSLPAPCSTAETAAKKRAATTAKILAQMGALSKLAAVVPASRLDIRPASQMVSSGIPQLDALTGGIARGCLTEICGSASSGRTSVLLSALACATQLGEVCALVDASDALDPASAAAAGVDMGRLLWVRCGAPPPRNRNLVPAHPVPARRTGLAKAVSEGTRWESQLGQMLKVTDLLLQSNGFGMIALDLGDVPIRSVRKIPLASWFRFRRAVENTPTVLLALEQQPIAGSCSSVLLQVSGRRSHDSGKKLSTLSCQHSINRPAHSELLDQFEITAELLRSRLERKPAQSAINFRSRAVWAGQLP